MAQPETPVTQQRRLRAELKRAREQSGMTQREVAKALDWAPSKVIRIETVAVIMSPSDLMPLLPRYGVSDRKRIESWVEADQASQKQARWDKYRTCYNAQSILVFGCEASTIRLTCLQAVLISGPLHTHLYSDGIALAYTDDGDEIACGAEVYAAGFGRTSYVNIFLRSRVGSAPQHQHHFDDGYHPDQSGRSRNRLRSCLGLTRRTWLSIRTR